MRLSEDSLRLSATDVANHLSCHHLTTLELRLAKGEVAAPTWQNPHAQVLQQRGRDHEEAYIARLQAQNLTMVNLSRESEATATAATLTAMQNGAQAIVQASLGNQEWSGRADVLLRVEHTQPTRFGNWSYEVVDCKLSR